MLKILLPETKPGEMIRCDSVRFEVDGKQLEGVASANIILEPNGLVKAHLEMFIEMRQTVGAHPTFWIRHPFEEDEVVQIAGLITTDGEVIHFGEDR
jgi:hypothetical protein